MGQGSKRVPSTVICSREREAQIVVYVMEANILDHWSDQRVLIRNFAIFYVAADQVTKAAAKIFVSRIREKRP